jgi:rubrerythrin
MEYYRSVAAESTDAEVQRLATEFANEEAEHVAALDKWIALTPRPSSTWQDDPDPLAPAA